MCFRQQAPTTNDTVVGECNVDFYYDVKNKHVQPHTASTTSLGAKNASEWCVSRGYYGSSFKEEHCKSRLPMVGTAISVVFVMLFSKVYKLTGVLLVGFENYRTQTEFDDVLIVKSFGFQFVNTYYLLFYLCFLKSGTPGPHLL